VVFLGGTAGMATAAEHALPGEALYPVKRAIEHAQTGLSTSSAGKGRALLTQAGDRLSEASGLLAQGTPTSLAQVSPTLRDFTTEAQQGSGLMMSSYRDNHDPASIVAVRRFAADSLGTLRAMARSAPADNQDELAAAAVALSGIDQQARDLCAACAADLPDLAVPPTFQASAEVDRALRQVQGVHLNNSHPVAVDGQLEQALPGSGSTAPAAGSGAAPGTSTPADSGAPVSGLQAPSLPDTQQKLAKGAGDAGNAVGGTVKKVTGGLNGAVQTLLPDPTSTNLP
jgi:hypothetical protein